MTPQLPSHRDQLRPSVQHVGNVSGFPFAQGMSIQVLEAADAEDFLAIHSISTPLLAHPQPSYAVTQPCHLSIGQEAGREWVWGRRSELSCKAETFAPSSGKGGALAFNTEQWATSKPRRLRRIGEFMFF